MGREHTLLDRIASGAGKPGNRYQASASEDVNVLLESVRRQLERLLNARHEMCETVLDYGLPAMTDMTIGSGDYVRRVEDAIRVTVETYEPRLRNVRVSRKVDDEEEQQRGLAFRIDATLVTESGQHRVWYETEVNGGGYFDVVD